MQWIKVIQANVELQVANNGHLSHCFKAVKGVAQGDTLSPYLFILMIETLGIFLQHSPRIKGLQWGRMEKIVSFVVDDSLLYVECTATNFAYLHEVLTHFQTVSGLHINFDKSVMIPLNMAPSWTSLPAVREYRILQFGEIFTYLGVSFPTDTGNANRLNFLLDACMVDGVLSKRKIRYTCITGRILQIKTLIASKFVYRFMLLPTPDILLELDRLYFTHVWEGGHHRISKNVTIAPKNKGEFNMFDVFSQEESLKLKWVVWLLSEHVNFSMWSVYIINSFNIPIVDALCCYVSGKYFEMLLQYPIPKVWLDIFKIWFDRLFVNKVCKDPDRRNDMFNTLFCFNEVIRGGCSITDDEFFEYHFLIDNNVRTLADFWLNKETVLSCTRMFFPQLYRRLLKWESKLPRHWLTVLMDSPGDHTVKLHWVDHCLNATCSTKQFYQWLVAKEYTYPSNKIALWTHDLENSSIAEQWERICQKLSVIHQPSLQDFACSFLLRGYLTNVITSRFMQVLDVCTFCKMEAETWCHLFWHCPKVKLLWTRVIAFCSDYIDDEVTYDIQNCLLSNFDRGILVLITVVTKFHIFLAKLNNWKLSYLTVLKAIKRQRDVHLDCISASQMAKFYTFWGLLLSDDIFTTESELLINF